MKFFSGNIRNASEFRTGTGAGAKHGCGVTFRGEFYYFGGQPDSKQLSKIVGCELSRQDDLPFKFLQGACNIFQISTDERPGLNEHLD